MTDSHVAALQNLTELLTGLPLHHHRNRLHRTDNIATTAYR
jgi:hypothetical protein